MTRRVRRFNDEELRIVGEALADMQRKWLAFIDGEIASGKRNSLDLECQYDRLREVRAVYERVAKMLPISPTKGRKR